VRVGHHRAWQGYPAEEVSGCGPLTCTPDAIRLVELAKKCGCQDVKLMCDLEELSSSDGWLGWPDKANIVSHFEQMGSRCQSGDTFVFFFSGHGTQTEKGDTTGEVDGRNEELCVCRSDGS
jgi:hypothetical protein